MRVKLGLTGEVPGTILYDPRGTVRRNPGGKRFGISISDVSGIRALLDSSDDGPGLSLFDTAGKMRSLMDVIDDVPVFLVSDARGNVRGSLAMTSKGASLTFFDSEGKVVAPAR
jgi:hypothetical protein